MLSNITSINLDLQTQGSALVAKQVNALVSPARRIYVFGTATDAFPYFSTFANALTYANSLTPSTTNPVSIVLLSNTNGTPVEISGADDWYALCLDGIYVSSPYREIFSTTTLPTTLPKGMRVMYEDANGTESLWVGNADGSAWPSVGYKTQRISWQYSGSVVTLYNVGDFGTVPITRSNTGIYSLEFGISGMSRDDISLTNLTDTYSTAWRYVTGVAISGDNIQIRRFDIGNSGALVDITTDIIISIRKP